ncbi:MAG: transcriptional regulator, LysR family [Herbinix sp.]|nr:transcriptional regulator, LysR family [Herbinix sp.]
MDSFELRIFREVANENSISKAAIKLGYVQSNVTTHIHHLEQELGVMLFIRHSKGVSLTESGKLLLPYADQIIALLDNAKQSLQETSATLRIGSTQTIASYKLPYWLSLLKQLTPNQTFSITTGSQDDLISAIAAGELDCIFINTDYCHNKLTTVVTYSEELVIIAEKKSMNEHDLISQPIIVNNLSSCPYRNLLLNWILSKSNRYPQVIEFDTLEAIINAVSFGMGITLLPISAVPKTASFAIYKDDAIETVKIQLITPKDTNYPHLQDFIHIVKDNN